eukprot:PITA_29337
MGFEKYDMDFAPVPAGLLLLSSYRAWLLYRIKRHPTTTVIGLNALNREIWLDTMMADGIKNGVLAVQTLRNNIMASTLLASTAITLSSLIGILVGGSGSGGAAAAIIYGDDSRMGYSVKYFAILVCFLIAFLFSVQSIRYYSHVSFLINVPAGKPGQGHSQGYVSQALNRASCFWSLGAPSFLLFLPSFSLDVRPHSHVCVLLYHDFHPLLLGHCNNFLYRDISVAFSSKNCGRGVFPNESGEW